MYYVFGEGSGDDVQAEVPEMIEKTTRTVPQNVTERGRRQVYVVFDLEVDRRGLMPEDVLRCDVGCACLEQVRGVVQ